MRPSLGNSFAEAERLLAAARRELEAAQRVERLARNILHNASVRVLQREDELARVKRGAEAGKTERAEVRTTKAHLQVV